MNEFEYIVSDILNSEEFNKVKYIEHHGVTRYDHLYRVSYYSYLISKKLHFKYKEVARAALLHDFFYSDEIRTKKEKFMSTFYHPKWALDNANKNFKLSKLEHITPIVRIINTTVAIKLVLLKLYF